MKKKSIFFFSFILSLNFVNKAYSKNENKNEILNKIKDFTRSIEKEKKEQQGYAIAILYKDQVIYKSVYGNRKGNKNPITSKTLFPLASVSKPVTATAVALMVQKGKIDLYEPFNLPYLKNPIQFTNILSHTTGYQFSGNMEIEQGFNRTKLLNSLKNHPVNCEPTDCYLYSNATFSLVEDALELNNLNLNDIMSNLNHSLKINDIKLLTNKSNADVAFPHLKGTVKGKTVFKPLPFPPYYPKVVPASAGVFASINGMVEFYKLAFGYKPKILSPKIAKSMFTPVILNKDAHKWNIKWPVDKSKIESSYALGWRILNIKDRPNNTYVYHPGYINGITSFIGYIPSKEVGIIILTNQGSKFASKNGIELWRNLIKNEKKIAKL
ncbi:serine hydrolase [Silvanigrella paludirubra]|uniref:Serine hydrolase n=1 Tax=Silvanigrella paludirubra TaxID=2499159 RepID=A0A6N6VWJ6_9BACT|nr:serine hydrolase domain-containing protein [Silvanigrella paludirubra]KAB8040853.1 serine hydrolase [Silvanigrella paludirubra]